MAKTIATIALEAARQLGEEYLDPDAQETFDQWVLEAIHEILSDASWPFATQDLEITTIASQAEYQLPLTTGTVTTIYRSVNLVRELERTLKETLVDRGKDMNITGEPEYWYPHGMSSDQKVVGLYPIPPSDNVVYKVHCVLDPSQLARTDTFPMPEDFIPSVLNFVRKLYKESAGDYNGADRAGTAFAISLRRIRTKYLNPVGQKYRFMDSDLPHREVINHLRFPDTIS